MAGNANSGRKPLLEHDPDLTRRIADNVKLGAWDYVAAEAEGVTTTSFYEWIARGNADLEAGIHSVFSVFADEIRRASAIARQRAEQQVNAALPLPYLKYGPGRERPGRKGWTESTQITGNEGGPIVIEDGRTKLIDFLTKKLSEGDSNTDNN